MRTAFLVLFLVVCVIAPPRQTNAFTWPWEQEVEELKKFGTGREGKCGATDLVVVIDRTYSLVHAIAEMKREVNRLLDLVAFVSGGDYKLGLIAFRDRVEVLMDLSQDQTPAQAIRDMKRAVRELLARGGNAGPEASDEAVRTAVLGLGPENGRPQRGRFSGDWKARTKILVLITDNLPGGFDDEFTLGVDDVNARAAAGAANDRGIRVSSIFIPVDGFTYAPDPRIEEIMRNYAQLTGGIFATTTSSGKGVAEAIAGIIDACGTNQMS